MVAATINTVLAEERLDSLETSTLTSTSKPSIPPFNSNVTGVSSPIMARAFERQEDELEPESPPPVNICGV